MFNKICCKWIVDKYKKWHEILEELCIAKFVVDYNTKVWKNNKEERLSIGFHLINIKI